MRPVEELCAAVDEALSRATFTRVSEGIIARAYTAELCGMRVRASLSVFLDTGGPHRMTSGLASGYELSLECDNGVATRFVVGTSIPLLLGRGLPSVARSAILGCEARADDVPWFESRVLSPQVTPALATLVREATYIEQRPGVLTAKRTCIGSTAFPAFDSMLSAFAELVRASIAQPGPRPATPRLSDNRVLMMVILAVFVIGGFVSCVASYFLLVS